MHIFKIDQSQRHPPPSAPPPHPITTRSHHEPFQALNITEPLEHSPDLRDYFSLTARADTSLTRATYHDHHNSSPCHCHSQHPSSHEQHELRDLFTAPMIAQRLRQPLTLCEVTVLADLELPGDQAGIFIFAGDLPASTLSSRTASTNRSTNTSYTRHIPTHPSHSSPSLNKWAKISIEQSRHGQPLISTTYTSATTSSRPDTAFTALSLPASSSSVSNYSSPPIRLKLERTAQTLQMWYRVLPPESFYDDDNNTSNNTYIPTPAEISREWRLCREIEGFFDGTEPHDPGRRSDENTTDWDTRYRRTSAGRKLTTLISPSIPTAAAAGQNLWIGCYAARPARPRHHGFNHVVDDDDEYTFDYERRDEFHDGAEEDDLFVEFEGLEVL